MYRNRIFQVNTRLKALDEIYKIYTSASLGEDLHTFALLESDRKIMKSASRKRPPDEAHGPGEEAIRPQQRCLGK